MTTIEVITSVQRRRRWSPDEKPRIGAESAQPERTSSQVARDHGIAPGQLFTWPRQLLAEAIAHGVGADGFVPVEIAPERAAPALPGSARAGERAIAIRLPNGIVIGVSDGVEVEPLRRVLTALAGR